MVLKYLVSILAMLLAIAAGINVITGGIYISKKETEIAPGLIWKYYSDNYSRLFWNGHGMVAEGPLILTFCDYGLCVSSSEDRRIRYLDLLEQSIVDVNNKGTNLWKEVGVDFSIDAASAMGIYDDSGKVLFEQERNKLRARVLAKGPVPVSIEIPAENQSGVKSDVH